MNDVEIEQRLTAAEERTKSNTHRLDDVEKRQDNLDAIVSAVAVMQKDIDYTKGDIQEIKTDVKTIMDKPGQNWDAAVKAIIAGIIGIVLGVLATAIH